MFSLTYVSSATRPMSESQLMQLLVQCSACNAKSRITGMLLLKEGKFIQVLEGTEASVQEVCARIRRDQRHQNLVLLHQGPVAKREFPHWSMGFQNLDRLDAWNMKTCVEDILTAMAANRSLATPSRSLQLLADFIGL